MQYTEKKQNQDKKNNNISIKGGDCGDNAKFKPSIATFTVNSWKKK